MVDFSAILAYNLIRKATGCESDSPSVKLIMQKEIASKLSQGSGCYFFLLLWLSMYDKAAKTTNNRVRTSNVFIGHHPPSKLEGI
jgi:hypothetical protein